MSGSLRKIEGKNYKIIKHNLPIIQATDQIQTEPILNDPV